MSALHPHPHHSENGWDVPERDCKAETCTRRFKPDHPRQMYCHADGCPGPPPPTRTRRRTSLGPQRNRAERPPAEEARATAVKGFLADVLVAVHFPPGPAALSIPEAVEDYMDAARAGRQDEARELGVLLCSMVASRYFTDASAPR